MRAMDQVKTLLARVLGVESGTWRRLPALDTAEAPLRQARTRERVMRDIRKALDSPGPDGSRTLAKPRHDLLRAEIPDRSGAQPTLGPETDLGSSPIDLRARSTAQLLPSVEAEAVRGSGR